MYSEAEALFRLREENRELRTLLRQALKLEAFWRREALLGPMRHPHTGSMLDRPKREKWVRKA